MGVSNVIEASLRRCNAMHSGTQLSDFCGNDPGNDLRHPAPLDRTADGRIALREVGKHTCTVPLYNAAARLHFSRELYGIYQPTEHRRVPGQSRPPICYFDSTGCMRGACLCLVPRQPRRGVPLLQPMGAGNPHTSAIPRLPGELLAACWEMKSKERKPNKRPPVRRYRKRLGATAQMILRLTRRLARKLRTPETGSGPITPRP
jgi:hypothetical protein